MRSCVWGDEQEFVKKLRTVGVMTLTATPPFPRTLYKGFNRCGAISPSYTPGPSASRSLRNWTLLAARRAPGGVRS